MAAFFYAGLGPLLTSRRPSGSPGWKTIRTGASVAVARDVEAEVRNAAERVTAAFGVEIYDVQFRRLGPRWKLLLLLSKQSGDISLEECERVSRQLSRELDVLDPIPHSYDLEVSSPGLERPLTQLWHWSRARGQQVRAKWRKEDGSVETAVVSVCSVDEGRREVRVVAESSDSEQVIPFDSVLQARVQVDWSKEMKSGGSHGAE